MWSQIVIYLSKYVQIHVPCINILNLEIKGFKYIFCDRIVRLDYACNQIHIILTLETGIIFVAKRPHLLSHAVMTTPKWQYYGNSRNRECSFLHASEARNEGRFLEKQRYTIRYMFVFIVPNGKIQQRGGSGVNVLSQNYGALWGLRVYLSY